MIVAPKRWWRARPFNARGAHLWERDPIHSGTQNYAIKPKEYSIRYYYVPSEQYTSQPRHCLQWLSCILTKPRLAATKSDQSFAQDETNILKHTAAQTLKHYNAAALMVSTSASFAMSWCCDHQALFRTAKKATITPLYFNRRHTISCEEVPVTVWNGPSTLRFGNLYNSIESREHNQRKDSRGLGFKGDLFYISYDCRQ